jgi:hypothetical protein
MMAALRSSLETKRGVRGNSVIEQAWVESAAGGFNRSSQHQIIEQILDTRPVLRPGFSNPVFFVVWNSRRIQPVLATPDY